MWRGSGTRERGIKEDLRFWVGKWGIIFLDEESRGRAGFFLSFFLSTLEQNQVLLVLVGVAEECPPHDRTCKSITLCGKGTLQIGLSWEFWGGQIELFCCTYACSVTQSRPTLCKPWTAAPRLPSPSPSPGACANSCPSSWWCHPTILILCHPLLLLPSIFPSIGVFSNELALHIRCPKYWNFSFCFSSDYSGLISCN